MRKTLSFLVIVALLALVGFSKHERSVFPTAILPSGIAYTIEINGVEHHYLNYRHNTCYFCGANLSVVLKNAEIDAEKFLKTDASASMYLTKGTGNYEAIVRKNLYDNTTSLLTVCLSDFSQISDLLSFFGVTSATNISSYYVSTLTRPSNFEFKENEDLCFESTNPTKIQALYNLLSFLTPEKMNSNYTCACVLAKSTTDAFSADRIIRIDIHLKTDVIIPLEILLSDMPNQTGYIRIADKNANSVGTIGSPIIFVSKVTSETQTLIDDVASPDI